MDEKIKQVLKRQRLTYLGLICAVLVLGFAIFVLFTEDNRGVTTRVQTSADLPGDDIDTGAVLLSRVETQNQTLDSKMRYLESLLLESKKHDVSMESENAELKKQIANLNYRVSDLKEAQSSSTLLTPSIYPSDDYFGAPEQAEIALRPPLTQLVSDRSEYQLKKVDTSIPAGTTVRAVLVSSVDASCGTNAVSDPQPIKLRILDDGHLPKGVDVDLRGGIIIASAYGDISSERAYVRLERLTQVNPSGDYIETEVTGYVSGEDGKYGIRGIVVDRSEKQVQNAALSGFFSGVGQLAQAAIDAKYYGGCGGCCDRYDHHQNRFDPNLLGDAALSGTSSAFDRLSEYYIKRSEQIRPVIQIGAGRIVDITFTHGAEVGDLHTKKKVEELRQKSRRRGCNGL